MDGFFLLLLIGLVAWYLLRPSVRKRRRSSFGLMELVLSSVVVLALIWLTESVSSFVNWMGTYHPRLSVALLVFGSILLIAVGYLYLQRRFIRWPFRIGGRSGASAHSLGELLMLSPLEFEQSVGSTLERIGYGSVRHVGGSGDLAADILCKDEKGRLVAVQCKRYAPGKQIGSPDIQMFMAMALLHHKAALGVFVSTSGFTQAAVDLASGHPIVLVDGDGLLKLMNEDLSRESHWIFNWHRSSPSQILASVAVR